MMLASFVVILTQFTLLYGAPGCIDLKKKYSDLKIPRKPRHETDGVCGLSRTCCSLDVETAFKTESIQSLRRVVAVEVDSARKTLQSVKQMTQEQMLTMIEELVPADIAESLDIPKIADAIWQYTVGDITAYNLTIEIAVIGSKMLFTDRAAQNLIDMTECIIRELGRHATDAFTQISGIIENVLEAPRTFGEGFQVVEILLDSVSEFEISDDCTYGELVGCPRCGVRMPGACRSSCNDASERCLANVYELTPLWNTWVDSIARLVNAMLLMKDIQVDPQDLVTPGLIEDVTNDIMTSMVNVNFRQCRGVGKRSAPSFNPGEFREKRQMSEGDLLKALLSGFFDSFQLNYKSCKDFSSDTKCWLGDRVGDYDASTVVNAPARTTKSYSPSSELATIKINDYVKRVDAVISNIHAKVRDQRSRVPYPEGYTKFSSGTTQEPNKTLHMTGLLITLLFYKCRVAYI